MKKLFVLYIFLMIGSVSFAQKKDSSDNTQDKNKKEETDSKVQSDTDQENKSGQDQEVNKEDKQTQDTRYQEGSSGVKRSISYKFSNAITDNDPGNGVFRYNKDNITGITYIFLDDIDLSGEDQTKWYSTWDDTTGATGRGRINIVEYEGKNVNVFDIKGVFVEEDGYWKIPVVYVSGSLPADGITYYYIFERIENKDKTSKEEVKEEESKVEETVAVAAVVTAAVVVTEPTPDPQPAAVVEEKKEEPAPAPQPEPVVEAKEEPVVQQEPVAENKEEPASQPEPVKEESKVEETVAVAAVVTAAAVVAEPTPTPQPAAVVEEKKEEPAPAPQPEPVAEAKEEPVVQQEPVAEKKEEPVSQPEPVKEESKVAEPAAVAAAITVAAVAAEPKAEPVARTTQQSQPAPKTQAPQQAPPKQESKPAQPTQQAPVSQPKTTSQSTQQQPAPVKKETPASQPAPQKTQPAPKPAQPESRPAQPQTTPSSGYPSSGTGYSGSVFTKKNDGSRVFHGIIETGYGFRVSDYGINNYRINFIGSFSLGQHFMIGLGLGYRNYFDKPEKHTDWYLVSGKSQVPVFLDLRYLFTKKKLTPFVALGVGGSTEKSKSDTTSFGSFINPSAGIWYRLSKNTALFADIAYEGIEMEFAKPVDNIPFRRKNNSISLNIGIQF